MAITINLSVDQGADFEATIKLYSDADSVLDLTSYGAQAQMRRSYDSTTTSAVFSVNLDNAASGELVLGLTDVQTAALKYGRYVYDVIITNSSTGAKTRAAEGIVTVLPGVTR